ncbi:hypothetical protein [Burkholderia vietnamiensis]|uniref:hypothetical protein n=1 Tax=Burkholderia vietnamiensis TaxID=60552 RepID=UPI001CAFF023|nr:hypothetical protein [Burkholderia vietnamiensis]CAG9228570.1 hypothetical protein BVI1335_70059 [Burkholderia vietnamiensis]HDR9086399.1 hypothetical protein [Burkholderia vietnamiensis]
MKKLNEPMRIVARNGWGHYCAANHQEFEVEVCDIGKVRPHYLGHNHRSHTFVQADVGRVIVNMTDGTAWSCWAFKAGAA